MRFNPIITICAMAMTSQLLPGVIQAADGPPEPDINQTAEPTFAPRETTRPAAATTDLEMIQNRLNAGQRLFLLAAEDGYSYVVGITHNRVYETFPPKIDVVWLGSGKSAPVKLNRLQPFEPQVVETLQAERNLDNAWQPLPAIVLTGSRLLASSSDKDPTWTDVPLAQVRFQPLAQQ